MGKRSEFERIPKDFYRTIDPRAVEPLKGFLIGGCNYYEPCCGQGDLMVMLDNVGFSCVGASDISTGVDALSLTVDDLNGAELIITNPPWSRDILHPLIDHLSNLLPTVLLFDADWAHTKQARPYLKYCHGIISVGRLKWIEGTTMSGKDNCAWYCFDRNYEFNGTMFFPQGD